ncbi:MAG: hypothetical protein KKC84_06785 [Candidatus Omnitrophica bacterium]|nr:hypothetical protein [Candidatus Omnitrophota bacterium]
MDQKLKFILIGLVGVAAIAVILGFLYFQSSNTSAQLLRERDELETTNVSLTGRVKKLEKTLRDNEDRLKDLNSELDAVDSERRQIASQLDRAIMESERLTQELKSRSSVAMMTAPQQALSSTQPQIPQTTDAYWADLIKAKTNLELQLTRLNGELENAQISNEQLQREKAELELDISNFKKSKDDLKRQLEYNQKIMDSIAQELVRERNDKTKIEENFKAMKTENSMLMRQLRNLNSRKIVLDKRIQELAGDKSVLERRFVEMETMLTDRISQINELKDQLDIIRTGIRGDMGAAKAALERKEFVELPPIVVRPGGAGPYLESPMATATVAAATIDSVGRVLSIDRDNNFVIIDRGEDLAVRVGDMFQVYAGNENIADVEVIKSSRTAAACEIKRESKQIKVGDQVR